ncbi:hypothetical protein [Halioxenophilus sp. WMMB6]|uniref:hypothetical protein n=1 Tax=Halioxenophilus sp. WMMB6 TaxID=3073815 RepID=UPI00295EECCA|nr:hypothetical protein [Halioxenophilus sp. WMMB6]
MFDKDRFIQNCIEAVAEGKLAVQAVVAEAVSDRASLISALGEPAHAGLSTLYRSDDLTIIDFAWAPCMSLMPHNHQMFSVVGIYSGREDNLFWGRTKTSIEAIGAKSLGAGEVVVLGEPIIHSVLNPIGKMTRAIHVYGGDFFQPHSPRSEWEHETLTERSWNMERVKQLFAEAESRFNATANG